MRSIILLSALALVWCVSSAHAQDMQGEQPDTIGTTLVPANPDDDFVRASIMVASPGRELYSVLGHAVLRLQCPTHGLDYVFSEESEDVNSRVLAFFAGKLRMRTMAVPTREYTSLYAAEGRTIDEYELHLPIAVKQRLWQQMDERLTTSDGPYDYLRRSCAQSVLRWITDAVDADSIDFGQWPEYYSMTRKELAASCFDDMWARVCVSTFAAGVINDPDVPNVKKVLAPEQLVEVMSRTTAYGTSLVSYTTTYQPTAPQQEPCCQWLTPVVVALALLLLALANLRLRWRPLSVVLLALGVLLGCFVAYLIFLSDLTCTEWNWLIVPFSPLPALLWRWRRRCLPVLSGVNMVWAATMMLLPHEIVDPAHIILAVAVAVAYVEMRD